MPFFIAILGLAGIVGMVWKFSFSRGTLVERAIDALTSLLAAALVIVLLARICQLANVDWIEGKLAPVVGMTRGYPLYQDPDTGVMTGWIYGPVGALVLLPAAVAKDPTTARIIGNSIMVVCSIVPAAWILWLAAGRKLLGMGFTALLLFGWMLVYAEDLGRCATMAGADAPAIAMAVCACGFLWRGQTPLSLCLSALCAILCVWTKQNFMLIIFGLAFYVAMARGAKPASMYALLLIGWAVIVSAILFYCFGASRMYFHMVTLPGSHPFARAEDGIVMVFTRGTLDLLHACAISLALLCAMLLLDGLVRAPAASVREWIATRQFSLLLMVAICLAPGALLGYVKISGYVNNFGGPDHFILLAALAGAVESCAKARPQVIDLVEGIARRCLAVPSLVMGIWVLLHPMNSAIWPTLMHPYRNSEETTFNYIQAHRGEVYCPWAPLTTLLADGKLYHFEWGLIDRIHAKLPISDKQYADHLPARLTKIVYSSEPISSATLEVISSFRRRIQVPELPGCVVYVNQAQ